MADIGTYSRAKVLLEKIIDLMAKCLHIRECIGFMCKVGLWDGWYGRMDTGTDQPKKS